MSTQLAITTATLFVACGFPFANAVSAQASDPESTICSGNATAVVLLVDPTLLGSIRSGLSQFERDLCSEGYLVVEKQSNFSTPPEVRNYLADLYARTSGRLEGAIFIGDIPHAYQWVVVQSANPAFPDTREEAISLQYYADLDGTFAASPSYVSPGGHVYSYDVHSGNTNWEIWTGILPYYKGSVTESVGAINRYFTKNHFYRTIGSMIPRAFLQINELHSASTQAEQDQQLAFMRSGTYSWTPFSNAPNARLYLNGPTLSVSTGYADLTAGVANFTDTDTHGNWYSSGQLSIPWVESNPVKTIFFWSSGCAIGDIDRMDNFLSSIVYSPTTRCWLAKAQPTIRAAWATTSTTFMVTMWRLLFHKERTLVRRS